ncbi:hypothetical protein [Arsenicicoccus dermatophilus]|uniref:hypothetical protein n=1 Tax=Arsenicicoccus dermatophilus TaxID=1076331 RepID=UPI00391758CA
MPARRPASALALLTASALACAPAAGAAPAPTPTAGAPATDTKPVAEAPPGWRVLPAAKGFDLVRLPLRRTPVTDARPHVATAAGDLGPARTTPDGSVTITVDRLPTDLSSLVVRYGHATEAELLARQPRPAPGTDTDRGLAARSASGPGVVTTTYTAAAQRLPGLTQPQAITGRVVAPATGTRLPVVLLLHGRHSWCDGGDGSWPCKAPAKPVPNLEGYRYLQDELARRGYFTVSIDANAINAQDAWLADLGMTARSALVRAHLALLGTWRSGASAPFAGTIKSRYDATNTLLVGHSRGGEGVAYAAIEQEPAKGYKVGGLVLLGPTNFFHTSASTTPTLTVLPGCDGDVSDLQGAGYADGAEWYGAQHALSSVAYLPGANHNYFNTTWTPPAGTGVDDGSGTRCTAASRLTPARQRQSGVSLVALAADRFLKGKGDPAAIDGTGTLPADQRWMKLVTSATGGARRRLADPQTGGWAMSGATVCRGTTCAPTQEDGTSTGVHWNGHPQENPAGWRWDLRRSATLRLRAPKPVSVKGSASLDVRMALSPAARLTPTLRITDAAGRAAVLKPLGAAVRTGVSGTADGLRGRVVAQNVRFPLPARGIDLARIASVTLERGAGATGTAVVLDLAAARAGITPAVALRPSVLRMPARATVVEGAKPWTHVVNATLSAPAAQPLSALTVVVGPGGSVLRTVPVPARGRRIPIAMPVAGNTVWNTEQEIVGQVRVRGPVLVATPATTLVVTDDDPKPVGTLTPTTTARPGGALTWTFTLDRASGESVALEVAAVKATGTGLGVADVATAAREDWSLGTTKDVPLDQAQARTYVIIAPGARTGRITLPLAKGARVGRQVALAVSVEGAGVKGGTRVTGTVVK